MPTVSVSKEYFSKNFGRRLSDTEVEQLCFDFGLEVDDIVEEKTECGHVKTVYRIEVAANRQDLLCADGIIRALRMFTQRSFPHIISVSKQVAAKIATSPSVKSIRPFIVSAVLKNVNVTPELFEQMIDLQEKLHMNLGRQRTLLAIGIHDYSKISSPVRYEAVEPDCISFCPLTSEHVLTGRKALMYHYESGYLQPYAKLVKDEKYWPVISDAKNVVLSQPPLVNGCVTKVLPNITKHLLIEVTGTDYNKVNNALNVLISLIPCSSIECVEIDGVKSPHFEYRIMDLSLDSLVNLIGVTSLDKCQVMNLLTRMGFIVKNSSTNDSNIEISVPPYRCDVLHACDLAEDVAIAYGYKNIVPIELPPSSTVGKQVELNFLSDLLREEVARAGFVEVLTFSLCPRGSSDEMPEVVIANPRTSECGAFRTSLLPGLLKTVSANRHVPVPIKIFEVSDIVYLSNDKAVNKRKLAALFCDRFSTGFEFVHGLLDRLMQMLDIPWNDGYLLNKKDYSFFFDGRCAEILLKQDQIAGKIGVIHPDILKKHNVQFPCSCLEIDVEMLMHFHE